MTPSFHHLGRTYELTARPRPNEASIDLDHATARALLAVRLSDASRMHHLRAMLGACTAGHVVARLTDLEVIEDLAVRVARGRLHVYARRLLPIPVRIEEPAAEEAGLGPLSAKDVESAAEEAVDVPAQVAVMLQAARDGVPFCEECAKARQASTGADAAPSLPSSPAGTAGTAGPTVDAATFAPDPYAGTDVPAQAAAMRAAAADGAPFCEECEKARAAAGGGG